MPEPVQEEELPWFKLGFNSGVGTAGLFFAYHWLLFLDNIVINQFLFFLGITPYTGTIARTQRTEAYFSVLLLDLRIIGTPLVYKINKYT